MKGKTFDRQQKKRFDCYARPRFEMQGSFSIDRADKAGARRSGAGPTNHAKLVAGAPRPA